MPRILERDAVSPLDAALSVTVVDEPGPGGAPHSYLIAGPNLKTINLHFQEGSVSEAGVNGISCEVLISILIDQLEGFQKGLFASPYNENALNHLVHALDELQSRTKERMERGVEGTHQA